MRYLQDIGICSRLRHERAGTKCVGEVLWGVEMALAAKKCALKSANGATKCEL